MTDIRRIIGKNSNFTSQAAPTATPKESLQNSKQNWCNKR